MEELVYFTQEEIQGYINRRMPEGYSAQVLTDSRPLVISIDDPAGFDGHFFTSGYPFRSRQVQSLDQSSSIEELEKYLASSPLQRRARLKKMGQRYIEHLQGERARQERDQSATLAAIFSDEGLYRPGLKWFYKDYSSPWAGRSATIRVCCDDEQLYRFFWDMGSSYSHRWEHPTIERFTAGYWENDGGSTRSFAEFPVEYLTLFPECARANIARSSRKHFAAEHSRFMEKVRSIEDTMRTLGLEPCSR
jgi:hypothetical protein